MTQHTWDWFSFLWYFGIGPLAFQVNVALFLTGITIAARALGISRRRLWQAAGVTLGLWILDWVTLAGIVSYSLRDYQF